GELRTEFFAAFSLLGRLPQEFLGAAESFVELSVEVVAVGDHDDRRVLHLRLLDEFPGVANHGDALARSLRVPNDAGFARTGHDLVLVTGARLIHGRTIHILRGDECYAHGMELVV